MRDNQELGKIENLYTLASEQPQGMTPDQMRAAGIIPMQARVIGEDR